MPRKLLRRILPDRDALNRNVFLRRAAPFLTHPNLWHLNRHSVSGGLAVGLFCGLIPAPFQILSACLMSIVFKVNLPVAVFGTFYTNPLTVVPIYLGAYGLGRWITGIHQGETVIPPSPETDWGNLSGTLQAWLDWAMALGTPLVVGTAALAIGLALLGYLGTQLAWRGHVLWMLRKRRQRAKHPA